MRTYVSFVSNNFVTARIEKRNLGNVIPYNIIKKRL